MNARTSRTPQTAPASHGPTLDDPTPCKPACATCALLLHVEQLKALTPRAAPADVLAIMSQCIKPADWKAIIKKQLELAREGNKGAFEALMEYTLGRPPAMAAPNSTADDHTELLLALLGARVRDQDDPEWPPRDDEPGAPLREEDEDEE